MLSSALWVAILLQGVRGSASSLQDLTEAWSLGPIDILYPPSTPLSGSDAINWLTDQWKITNNKVSWGQDDISFVEDPSAPTNAKRAASSSTKTSTKTTSSLSPSASSSSSSSNSSSNVVLRIEYPKGSYSNNTGGTQFNTGPYDAAVQGGPTQPNPNRMLLAYDIYFSPSYQWVQGGKLPGLRGGPDSHGCSGGNATDGTGCFSTRLMWRTGGAGEVYAYIPTSLKNFCKSSDVICNSDYGTSLGRGSFSFVSGQWQTIWLLVVLNEVGTANGVVEVYYNGVQAISMTNLELRSSNNINSINGMFFSTFFGGSDSSWATPKDQYTYYRNFNVFSGTGAANGTGQSTGGAPQQRPMGNSWTWGFIGGIILVSSLLL